VSRWLRGPAAAELRAAAAAFRVRTEIEVRRAMLEELSRPDRPPVVEILRRLDGLREGLVAEEMRKARSRRRRPAGSLPSHPSDSLGRAPGWPSERPGRRAL